MALIGWHRVVQDGVTHTHNDYMLAAAVAALVLLLPLYPVPLHVSNLRRRPACAVN